MVLTTMIIKWHIYEPSKLECILYYKLNFWTLHRQWIHFRYSSSDDFSCSLKLFMAAVMNSVKSCHRYFRNLYKYQIDIIDKYEMIWYCWHSLDYDESVTADKIIISGGKEVHMTSLSKKAAWYNRLISEKKYQSEQLLIQKVYLSIQHIISLCLVNLSLISDGRVLSGEGIRHYWCAQTHSWLVWTKIPVMSMQRNYRTGKLYKIIEFLKLNWMNKHPSQTDFISELYIRIIYKLCGFNLCVKKEELEILECNIMYKKLIIVLCL